MADPEIVYKVAFLTFDLELVAMAAEFTQKDPKEYLPYLEELKAIPN
jgi:elongator complex protein 1